MLNVGVLVNTVRKVDVGTMRIESRVPVLAISRSAQEFAYFPSNISVHYSKTRRK
jgi:hypothetical protein